MRKPRMESAAYLKLVAHAQTTTSHGNWSGRVGTLGSFARLAAFQRTLRILPYLVQGALVGVLLLVGLATLPVLFGYHTYVVQGGSMGASLPAGSVAVSKPTSPFDLEIGDVIAQRASEDNPFVLHRIVDITVVDGQRLFTTQGDANRTSDPQPIALEGSGDRVVFSVPYAGYVLDFADSGPGLAFLIGAPLLLLATMFLRDRLRKARQGKAQGIDTPAEDQAAENLPIAPALSIEKRAPREPASVPMQEVTPAEKDGTTPGESTAFQMRQATLPLALEEEPPYQTTPVQTEETTPSAQEAEADRESTAALAQPSITPAPEEEASPKTTALLTPATLPLALEEESRYQATSVQAEVATPLAQEAKARRESTATRARPVTFADLIFLMFLPFPIIITLALARGRSPAHQQGPSNVNKA